jgi:polyisoprenoid-binding protein YceI
MTITTPEVLDRIGSPTRRWKVDREASAIEFSVRTFWGLGTVDGHFERFQGYYVDRPEGAAIELTIDVRSLGTGNATRDRHLRSKDFFDAQAYPEVRFTSTHVGDLGGRLAIGGTLEAAGRRVVLAFEATARRDGGALTVEATTTVDHRELGMTHSPLGMIRPPTTLHVRVRLGPDDQT